MVALFNQTPAKYGAIQWTGSNQQEFVDWIGEFEVMNATVVDGNLHLKKPNGSGSYYVLEPTQWLVSTATWGSGTPAPYMGIMDNDYFQARYNPMG